MAFSRQEYWSGLPSPSLGDLPDPGGSNPTGGRKIFAEMIDIALNLGKDVNLKIQGQQILSKINMKKTISRHIIAKLLRIKIKKILESSQRKSDTLHTGEQQLE